MFTKFKLCARVISKMEALGIAISDETRPTMLIEYEWRVLDEWGTFRHLIRMIKLYIILMGQ